MYTWNDDVAVLSRGKHGGIKVYSTWTDDGATRKGAGFGAVTGGLIGMMLGPGGALAGAAVGGSLGGLMGAANELKFNDPRLDEFAAAMKENTSALILVGEMETVDDFMSVTEPFGGKIIETDINEADVKALRKGLKKARKAA